MARTKKADEGVFWTRGQEKQMAYYWKIGKEKSKLFTSKVDCAMEFVTKYIERHPKYKDLVEDKTWDEIFKLFSIDVGQR